MAVIWIAVCTTLLMIAIALAVLIGVDEFGPSDWED